MKSSKRNRNKERRLFVKSFKSFRVPQADIDRLVRDFYQALDTPLSHELLSLYKTKDFVGLVSREIDPRSYKDPEVFQADYAAVSFLRKSETLKTGIDTAAVALESFRESEERCRSTNKRFMNLGQDALFKGSCVDLLNRLQRKISLILNEFDVDEFIDACAFGPGSSTTISGFDTSTVRKFREECSITSNAYQLFGEILQKAYPIWTREGGLTDFLFAEFSRVITVKKNAKTDRTIAIEPGLNLWLQKGLGTIFRRKLRRCGVDLNKSERNARLARQGSLDGSICTVDFSSASDTIALWLIITLFPAKWFTILDACRTRGYIFGDDVSTRAIFHKFSSMGNGFTFELESLIFYSAALVCCEFLGIETSKVSVFGDDVVMPTEAYQLYSEFTHFLGFTINKTKSFADGEFRESCGSYYFAGRDVKPMFQKKSLRKLNGLYKFANRVSELAERFTPSQEYGRSKRFQKLHESIISIIPEKLRLFGDKTGGQGCIWSNFDQANPSKLRGQIEGYSFNCLKFTAGHLESYGPEYLVAKLDALRHKPMVDHAINRGSLSGNLPSDFGTSPVPDIDNRYSVRSITSTRLGRVSALRWYNWGMWI